MSTNGEPVSGEHIQNPEVTYERRDLSARGVLAFLIALAIAGVIIHIALWGIYKWLDRPYFAKHPTTVNTIATGPQQLPRGDPAVTFPAPRLQPDPVADLNKFRAREEQILNSYGWVDPRAGTVHIPIDKAMEMVAQQGLPVRPQAPVPQGAPSESGAPGKTSIGKEPASRR